MSDPVAKGLPEGSHCPNITELEKYKANTDPNDWSWPVEDMDEWQIASAEWQSFFKTWRTRILFGRGEYYHDITSASFVDGVSAPIAEETLVLDPAISNAFNFSPALRALLVRKGYVEMFERVLRVGFTQVSNHGILISGQPGIGKTLFLYYLLTRLLTLNQPVLFSTSEEETYLFYRDVVYILPGLQRDWYGEIKLPTPTSEKKKGMIFRPDQGDGITNNGLFIWSLVDIQRPEEPRNLKLCLGDDCFMVQTAAPNPVRYYQWTKGCRPLSWGMKVWEREDLLRGLELQENYFGLQETLQTLFHTRMEGLDTSSWWQMAASILTNHEGAAQLLHESFPDNLNPPRCIRDAVEALVDRATYRYGYAARDVFKAILSPFNPATPDPKADLNLSRFGELVEKIYDSSWAHSKVPSLAEMHHIFVIRPTTRHVEGTDLWALDVKSKFIGTELVKELAKETVNMEELKAVCVSYKRDPGTRPLAIWFGDALKLRGVSLEELHVGDVDIEKYDSEMERLWGVP